MALNCSGLIRLDVCELVHLRKGKPIMELPEYQNPALLLQALTHPCFVNEHPEAGEHNQRMEFLGDAVLKFHLSERLYRRYPQFREGQLTQWRSEMEKNQTLAEIAVFLNLGQQVRLSSGTKKQGGYKNPKILSGALEAVIGGYFLDSGIEAAQCYIEQLFTEWDRTKTIE
jgi:ribonuclease III